jgi:hypothetical protein
MKRVLIGGGESTQEYAAITGALTTADAATDPSLLAVGSIGVYGYVQNGGGSINAANDNVSALITQSTNAAGKVADSDFVAQGNELVTIAQGGLNGLPTTVFNIQRKGVKNVVKQVAVSPAKQLSFIGYNGVNGSMNAPTITNGSEGILLAIQSEQTTPDKIREQEDYSSGTLLASNNLFDALSKTVKAINSNTYATHLAFVKSNGTYTAASGTTGAATLTKGSDQLVFATAVPTGWVAGDYIAIQRNNTTNTVDAADTTVNSAIFKVVSVSGATITLDRPYYGETQTITEANFALWASKVTAITEWGIALQVLVAGEVYNYAVQGIFEYATLTAFYTPAVAGALTTAPTAGLGQGAQVVKLEEDYIAYRGQLDTVDRRMKQLPRYASANLTYTAYTIQFTNSTDVTGAPHNKSENSTVMLLVPNGQASINDIDAIFKVLFTNASFNF